MEWQNTSYWLKPLETGLVLLYTPPPLLLSFVQRLHINAIKFHGQGGKDKVCRYSILFHIRLQTGIKRADTEEGVYFPPGMWRMFLFFSKIDMGITHLINQGCHPDQFCTGVSGNSRSRSFPRMEASDSLSKFREWLFFHSPSRTRISGMDFFHSLPVPEFREWTFFIPFPFPNFGNGFFSFPSRSRTLGMDFFHFLPVPELTLPKSVIKKENGRF